MPTSSALVLTLVSAGCYGLTFPTASLQRLAWVALAPFFLALRGASLGRALALGWVWTTVAAATLGDWFASSIARYYDQPLVVGLGFFFGVSSFLAAPYYMAFAACARTVMRRPGALTPLVVAAAWVGAELARVRLGGNPWALFGYSQMGSDALVQVADVTGVYGVSFLLVASNAAVAQLAGHRRAPHGIADAPRASRRTALAAAGVVAALVLLVLAYGNRRLAAAAHEAPGDPVPVAMVQGNLAVGSQWREEHYGENLDAYLRLTAEALRTFRPELVFWPESALTFFLADEPLYQDAIVRTLAPFGAELLVGGPRREAGTSDRYYNSVFLLRPDGAIAATYDKQRLVPFGEYFPFPGIEALHRRFARVREFTPGPSRPPLASKIGRAGVTICNEAMFPDIAAARVREGAQFFVDPANDTWLTPKFSAQQFDIVRLRTVEQRRYLVRASTSGPSAIVDPFGRVPVQTAFLTATAIGGTIRLRDDVTPYNRVGDLFALLCTLTALAAWLRESRRPRQDRPA